MPAKSYTELGSTIERDAQLLMEEWERRALEQQPDANPAHRAAMRNQLPNFLRTLGRSLAGFQAGSGQNYELALEHGQQRWDLGWKLDEVVRDYQILRVVLLEHVESALSRLPSLHEAIAMGLLLDRAIMASVVSFTRQAESRLRSTNEMLEQRVAERTEQLRTAAAQLLQAEQHERRRLASILHDTVQQSLVAAKMHLSMFGRNTPDELRQHVQAMDELLTDSIHVSRTMAVELSPPVLDEQGLIAALEWLSQQVHEKHGLSVELAADPQAEPDAKELRVLLFQAVQEALFNTVKHAKVDRACVHVTAHEDQLEVEVSDEGAGFDPEQLEGSAESFGLSSIRYRFALLGGSVRIDSAPGAGTRVMLRAPLR